MIPISAVDWLFGAIFVITEFSNNLFVVHSCQYLLKVVQGRMISDRKNLRERHGTQNLEFSKPHFGVKSANILSIFFTGPDR